MKKINDAGIDLIKSFEGCKLTAYKDSVGVWTIGYGHTSGVTKGMVITEERAEEMLKSDLGIFEAKVNKYDDEYDFTSNEFSALVSFAYNIGNIDQLTNFGKRTKKEIADKMLLYVHAGGKQLAGLKRRREAERILFLKDDEDSPKEENYDDIITIDDLVDAIIDGRFSNGTNRKTKIYDFIQNKVNNKIRGN